MKCMIYNLILKLMINIFFIILFFYLISFYPYIKNIIWKIIIFKAIVIINKTPIIIKSKYT